MVRKIYFKRVIKTGFIKYLDMYFVNKPSSALKSGNIGEMDPGSILNSLMHLFTFRNKDTNIRLYGVMTLSG